MCMLWYTCKTIIQAQTHARPLKYDNSYTGGATITRLLSIVQSAPPSAPFVHQNLSVRLQELHLYSQAT